MKGFFSILFIIAILFGIVAFQNNAEISVKFMKWEFTRHIVLVLAVPFAAGLVAGLSLLLPSLWKKSSQARYQKKRIEELEEHLPKHEESAHEEAVEEGAAVETELKQEEPEKPVQ